jgi:hypothetical protein
MSIVTPCPQCGCSCKVSDTAAGKKVKCPRCATPFPIPATNSAPPPPVQRPLSANAPARTTPAAHAAGSPRSGRPWLLLGIGAVVALVLAAGGGGLLVWALFLRSPAPSSATPNTPIASNDAAKQTPSGPSEEEVKAQQERKAARRRSVKNLKDLALAFHNHHETYNQYPPAMSVGWPCMPPPNNQQRRPQPFLSWRVLILPFLEQQELYNQFKLDEPWDSEHNKKLLVKMPKIYAPVRSTTPEAGMTYYQVFVTSEQDFVSGISPTPFLPAATLPVPPNPHGPYLGGMRMPMIFDGTSNTFLIVEGGEPVPWTKPADLEYNTKKPLPKLGGQFPDGFHAATFSTDVYFIPRDFSEKDLRRMINPSDGEPIESELKPLSDKDDDDEKKVPEFANLRGKVSYMGKPLTAGTLRFVGAKTFSTSIAADGSYELHNLPTGSYKVAVEVNRQQVRMPDSYGNADTSGIRFNVTKGDHETNILLQ